MLIINGEIKVWAMDFRSIMKEYDWWKRFSDEEFMMVAEVKYTGGELIG